jgi:flagellar hook-associated protein 2
LSGNREVQVWAQSLRSAAFAATDAPAGRLRRLEDLGIDFAAGKSVLTIKDPARLDAALRDRPAEVDALLRNATTGFATRLDTVLKATLGNGGSSGALAAQTGQINRSTAGIADQISSLERRLAQRRSQLEASFIAMETAQSRLQQMQSQLTRAFGLGSTPNK